jgi:hypothetical protein
MLDIQLTCKHRKIIFIPLFFFFVGVLTVSRGNFFSYPELSVQLPLPSLLKSTSTTAPNLQIIKSHSTTPVTFGKTRESNVAGYPLGQIKSKIGNVTPGIRGIESTGGVLVPQAPQKIRPEAGIN